MFFEHLFELAPADHASHQRRFTMMLFWMVDDIDNPRELIPALYQLGARHQLYGVTSEMFGPARTSLWMRVLELIATEMERGAEDSFRLAC